MQATKTSDQCIQYTHYPIVESEKVEGSEDCLYLNIHVPKERNNSLLPVLFWIHGGAFQFGTGNNYKAKYLADYGVILVSINYRLGPLGIKYIFF